MKKIMVLILLMIFAVGCQGPRDATYEVYSGPEESAEEVVEVNIPEESIAPEPVIEIDSATEQPTSRITDKIISRCGGLTAGIRCRDMDYRDGVLYLAFESQVMDMLYVTVEVDGCGKDTIDDLMYTEIEIVKIPCDIPEDEVFTTGFFFSFTVRSTGLPYTKEGSITVDMTRMDFPWTNALGSG